MRRITLWFLSTLTGLVLLFSYHSSTAGAGGSAAPTVAASGAGSGADGGTSSPDLPPTSDSQTYDGEAAQTRWGPVQVRITVANGRITAADVLQVPMANHHDQQINSYAVPILNSEVVDAQGADIDMVSGATDTSEGYLTSLQSAIDRAGL
ncbi:MAG TPA: FMN-binding protein [Pedococcus sp.]|jgi:hypothetical protein